MEVGKLPVGSASPRWGPPRLGTPKAERPDSRCSGSLPPEWLGEAGPPPPQLCGSGPRADPPSPVWPLKPSRRVSEDEPAGEPGAVCPEVGVVGAGRRTPHSRHWA